MLALVTIVFGLAASSLGCGPNSDGSKLKALERLHDELPIFPSMAEKSASKTSKGTLAVVSKLYCSDAPYSEVKNFYVAELGKKGWEYVGDRSVKDWDRDLGGHVLSFRSGAYRLSVTYAGKDADYGWDYAVETVWGN